jgi:hypothetical protein
VISAKYISNILSNKDLMPKKEDKIVRSATLFCDILKKDFFLKVQQKSKHCYQKGKQKSFIQKQLRKLDLHTNNLLAVLRSIKITVQLNVLFL